MIAVGIITAPRPRATLGSSILSLRGPGGYTGAINVYADGMTQHDLGNIDNLDVRVVPRVKPLGNLRNWVDALGHLHATSTEPYLMVCEDDITWADNAFVALEDECRYIGSLERAGAYSLFLPVRMAKLHERTVGHAMHPGWQKAGMQVGNKMWGAQCLMFTRAQAEWLLRESLLVTYTSNPKWTKNVDAIVAHCLNTANRNIYWRNPCLVNHTLGEGNSSLGYPIDRPNLRTHNFTGRP